MLNRHISYMLLALVTNGALIGCTANLKPEPTTSKKPQPVKSSSGGIFEEKDRPPDPDEIPDILRDPRTAANIPDAVVTNEPKSRYGNPESYTVRGKTYRVMASVDTFKETGHASWYGKKFHGRRTSSGEPYDMFEMTAAHKTLPLPCFVRVTHNENGKSIVVRVNDRGPFHPGRIIDLSYAAASKLDIVSQGEAPVTIELVKVDTVETPNKNSGPVNPVSYSDFPEVRPIPVYQSVPSTPFRPYIQSGSYSDPVNAIAKREQLTSAGFAQVTIVSTAAAGGDVHRVLLGPFSKRAEFDNAMTTLHANDIQGFPVNN